MNRMKRFFVSTRSENLDKLNHFSVYRLRTNEGKLQFYCNKKTFEKIKDEVEVEYLDLYKEKFNSIIRKHLITIISIILISLLLINQSIAINRIEFTEPDTYDKKVVESLDKYYRKIGPFNYLTTSLTDINYNLRAEFYEYEWIGIKRIGSVLYIDIKKQDNYPSEGSKQPGSIYASHSGIIKRYHVSKGVVLVQEDVYVNKGDMLISGKVTHYDNTIEDVRATGYVIAEVLEYYDYVVPKARSLKQLTGRIEINKIYSIFNLKLSSVDNKFANFEERIIEEKSFLGLIKIKKIIYFEEENISYQYNSEDAINYAKSLVRKDFSKTKVNEFERIIFNTVVRTTEDENNFYVRLLVRSHRNIASFVPLKE